MAAKVFAVADGCRLAYRVLGAGARTPLVLVQGLCVGGASEHESDRGRASERARERSCEKEEGRR